MDPLLVLVLLEILSLVHLLVSQLHGGKGRKREKKGEKERKREKKSEEEKLFEKTRGK